MNKVYEYWVGHGTKIIGFLQVSIAAVAAVDGIIPKEHLKYYMMALGLLTAWRGFFNSSQNNNQETK